MLLGYMLRKCLFSFVQLPGNLSFCQEKAHLADPIKSIRKVVAVIDFHNWLVVDHPPVNPV